MEVGAHQEVIENRKGGEGVTSLRHVADADRDDLVRVKVSDILLLKSDPSFGGFEYSGKGEEKGRLSRPIGSEEGDDLSSHDLEGDLMESGQRAVVNNQFPYLKHSSFSLSNKPQ